MPSPTPPPPPLSSLIFQKLLATRYWFFILPHILLPLIEFTPDSQDPRRPPLPLWWIFWATKRAHSGLVLHQIELWAPERGDMELDNRGKKEISPGRCLDKNEEKQRWVYICFSSALLFFFLFSSIQKWVWNDWDGIHAERSYLCYFSIFIHPNMSLRNKSYLLLQKCSFDCWT